MLSERQSDFCVCSNVVQSIDRISDVSIHLYGRHDDGHVRSRRSQVTKEGVDVILVVRS